jgi:death on curing protein
VVKVKPISIGDVQEIAHALAKKYMEWDEPIPEFGTRRSNILESCLIVPFQEFSKRPVYKGLEGKGAILFYLMVKNHPFQNGNKRVAVITLLVFLAKNNKWLRVDNQEFYNFAKWVAESNPKYKKQTVSAIEDFVKDNLVEF